MSAVHERCLAAGLTSTPDGRTDTVAKYVTDLEYHHDVDTGRALDAIEDASGGSVYYWTTDGMRLRVGVTDPRDDVERRYGVVGIGFQTSEIDGPPDEAERRDRRVASLLDLVRELVPLVEPTYGWCADVEEVEAGELEYLPGFPSGRPVAESVDDLSWLTVLSPDLVAQWGGREHVLATPAWRVEEFDTGHVLLVFRDHPFRATFEPDGSPADHLLPHTEG